MPAERRQTNMPYVCIDGNERTLVAAERTLALPKAGVEAKGGLKTEVTKSSSDNSDEKMVYILKTKAVETRTPCMMQIEQDIKDCVVVATRPNGGVHATGGTTASYGPVQRRGSISSGEQRVNFCTGTKGGGGGGERGGGGGVLCSRNRKAD